MDAKAGGAGRLPEVAQNWAVVRAGVALPHPAAPAVRAMAVVGRVAQAHQHIDIFLDRQRLLVFLREGQRGAKEALHGGAVGAFQRVRKIHLHAPAGQGGAVTLQGVGKAHFGYGIGANHYFKAVQVARQLTGLPGHGAAALPGRNPLQGMLNDAQQVGAVADGRVQRFHIGRRKPLGTPQLVQQQIVNQSHLGAHHRHRGVIDAGIPPQFRVVLRQKVLVEIQGQVGIGAQRGYRNGADEPQRHINRRRDFVPRRRVGKGGQRAGQQAVRSLQGALRVIQRHRVAAIAGAVAAGAQAARQQQGEDHRLRVGVGELLIGGVREQQMPPAGCDAVHCGIPVVKRLGDIIPQETA